MAKENTGAKKLSIPAGPSAPRPSTVPPLSPRSSNAVPHGPLRASSAMSQSAPRASNAMHQGPLRASSAMSQSAPRASNARRDVVSYALPRSTNAPGSTGKAARTMNAPPNINVTRPSVTRSLDQRASVTHSTGQRPSVAHSLDQRSNVTRTTTAHRPSVALSVASARPSVAASQKPRGSAQVPRGSAQVPRGSAQVPRGMLQGKKRGAKPAITKKKPVKNSRITKLSAYAIIEAFHPFWRILSYLCRFPLHYTKFRDGGFRFLYMPKDRKTRLFNGANYVLTGILSLVLLNLMSILTNFPKQYAKEIGGVTLNHTEFKTPNQLRAEELYLFHRNIIPAVFIVTELLQAVVGGWNFHIRRDLAASYLSLWSEAVETLRINPAVGLKTHMYWIGGIHCSFWILLLICSTTGFVPVSTGYPSMFAVLLFRIFVPHVHTWEHLWFLRVIAMILLIFIVSCAKIYTFFFYFHCRLLRNAFKVWNLRLDRVLHGGEAGNTKALRSINRTTFDQLFRDHICLLDLLGGADELHGNQVMMFYGTQLVALCLECYYFMRSQSGLEEFQGGLRQFDGIAITLYFLQTLFLLYFITVGASNVGEEFSDGLEVVRSKGMLGDKEDDELYFMLSMYMSFSGYPDTAMTAGKYFVLDKAFVVTMASAVFSYFVILIQFTPALRYLGPYRRFLTTEIVDSVLQIFEQTPSGFGKNNTV